MRDPRHDDDSSGRTFLDACRQVFQRRWLFLFAFDPLGSSSQRQLCSQRIPPFRAFPTDDQQAKTGDGLSKVKSGKGVDIIAYDAKRAHFYLPGDESATMAIIGVSAKGMLTLLGTVPTVEGAHCVTTDEHGRAYVCDPKHGQLLVIDDPYPAAGS